MRQGVDFVVEDGVDDGGGRVGELSLFFLSFLFELFGLRECFWIEWLSGGGEFVLEELLWCGGGDGLGEVFEGGECELWLSDGEAS